ncbi:putative MFS multidrug transporter [Podospora didyma]|uniref:MFS multidrug transporter n=1 Tax=Podospora didyma TaxID=330526 RepID=A0AAE0K651_9PEZI|nr:putative MFS multidrug transporter [Podospora didyma]
MMFKKKGGAKPAEAVVPGTSDSTSSTAAAQPNGNDGQGTSQPLEPTVTTATEDIVYPEGLRLGLLIASTFITMFLVSLDRLIVSTAIPQISNDFHSVTDIGWYGSSYLLTSCAFQLLFGKIYTFFAVKPVFLISIFLFELGSAVCGAAPNSVAFIIGRSIAGLGSAGIIAGVIVVIVYAVPLHKRPLYQGMFGAVFGVSSVIGPLLGGVFTSKVTWRWCFFINLPFGAVASVFIAFLLQVPERDTTKVPLKEKILQLDLYGTTALLPGVVCLLLALQWGGLEYQWSDGRIIALLTLAAVLLTAFVLIQIFKPDTATIPPRIFLQRSILAGVWATITIGAQMMIFVYFLPIWFQAVKGVNAVDSGIRLIPICLSMVIASMICGALTMRIGYYTPFMIFGCCFIAIGAGLLSDLQVDTPDPRWIGYQIVAGWGIGNTFQAPNLAAQTVLPLRDVPVGTSLLNFSQLLGGAIFISVGQNVLNNQLLERLGPLPGFHPQMLLESGATELIARLPEAIRSEALFQYNEALRKVFQVGVIMACLTILGAVAMEWRSVKKNVKKESAAAAEEGKAQSEEAAAVTGSASKPEVLDESRDVTDDGGEKKVRDEGDDNKDAVSEPYSQAGAIASPEETEKDESKKL